MGKGNEIRHMIIDEIQDSEVWDRVEIENADGCVVVSSNPEPSE